MVNIIGNQLIERIACFDLLGQQAGDGAARNISDGSNQFRNVAFAHNGSCPVQRCANLSAEPRATLCLELGDHFIFFTRI